MSWSVVRWAGLWLAALVLTADGHAGADHSHSDGPGGYCAKYQRQYKFFCRPSRAEENSAKTNRFCAKYPSKCFGQSESLGPLRSSSSPQRRAAAQITAGLGPSEIASLCSRYGALGQRFCGGGGAAVPAQYRSLCQAYNQNCAGGGGGGGVDSSGPAPASGAGGGLPASLAGALGGGGGGGGGLGTGLPSEIPGAGLPPARLIAEVERQCEANRELAEKYCFNGTPLPTAQERRCIQYRQYCKGDLSAVTALRPFRSGPPNDNLARIQSPLLKGTNRWEDDFAWAGGPYNDFSRYNGPAGGFRDGFGPRKSIIGLGNTGNIGVLGVFGG